MEKLSQRFNHDRTYGSLHRDFFESSEGEELLGTVRFARFKPDHVSNSEWVETLGADTDSLKHMPVTYGLMRAFLIRYRDQEAESNLPALSQEDEEVLLLASITNNWGEVRTGNIAYDQKTTDLEKEEKDGYRELLQQHSGEDLDVKVRMLVERTVFDKNSRLGQVFNAVERVGYLRTGLRAYREAKSTDDEVLAGHLKWLCANVLSNQIMMLSEYSKVYPPVREFLESQHSLISEAFESIDADVFSRHGQNETIRTELYWQNKRSWYEFNRFEAEDLKQEIIKTVLGAIAAEKPAEQAIEEIDSLLKVYARVLSGGVNGRDTSGTKFDRGLFGDSSNFEDRFIPDPEVLTRKIAAIRELGLKIVLTSGSFDLLHIGHAGYLEEAKKRGDVLVVGVDSDVKMKRKGPDRPMIPETERTRLLAYLRGVDIITIKAADEEKWGLIKLVRPDTLITTEETYTEKEVRKLHDYCNAVVVLPPQATTSTSAKIRRMNLGFGQKFLLRARVSIDTLISNSSHLSNEELKAKLYEVMEETLDEVASNG